MAGYGQRRGEMSEPKLSPAQQSMWEFLEAGALLQVGAKNDVFTTGRIYVGKVNTLESLVKLGLAEKKAVGEGYRLETTGYYYQKAAVKPNSFC